MRNPLLQKQANGWTVPIRGDKQYDGYYPEAVGGKWNPSDGNDISSSISAQCGGYMGGTRTSTPLHNYIDDTYRASQDIWDKNEDSEHAKAQTVPMVQKKTAEDYASPSGRYRMNVTPETFEKEIQDLQYQSSHCGQNARLYYQSQLREVMSDYDEYKRSHPPLKVGQRRSSVKKAEIDEFMKSRSPEDLSARLEYLKSRRDLGGDKQHQYWQKKVDEVESLLVTASVPTAIKRHGLTPKWIKENKAGRLVLVAGKYVVRSDADTATRRMAKLANKNM
jgi:hypothetical protein